MQRQEETHLYISNDTDSFFLEALARYLQLDKRFKVKIQKIDENLVKFGGFSSSSFYIDSTGKYVSTKVIAKRLAQLANIDELLLGETPQEVMEVASL